MGGALTEGCGAGWEGHSLRGVLSSTSDGHSPTMDVVLAENLMSKLHLAPGGGPSPEKGSANDIHRPQSLFGTDKRMGGFAPVRPVPLRGVPNRAFFTSGTG